MSDKLREAAKAALEELIASESNAWNVINDIEAALAEPSIKESLTVRPWVGLTDKEIDEIYKAHHNEYGECESVDFGYERAIEAKLRENNG